MEDKSPIDAWKNVNIKDLENSYGSNFYGIKTVIEQITDSQICQWVFPTFSMGKIILSRFNNYNDLIKGPRVQISYQKINNEYCIEYINNEIIKKTSLKSIKAEITKIETWLDIKVI